MSVYLEFKEKIFDFKNTIAKLLEDPVTIEPLQQAVTLFPCGHSFNFTTIQEIAKQKQICPLDKVVFTHSISNIFLQEITALLDRSVYDFHTMILNKFTRLDNGLCSSKIITLDPCGHTIKDKIPSCCPYDYIKTKNFAPSYTLQDIHEVIQTLDNNLTRITQNKPPFYLEMIHPKTSLKDLYSIPVEAFQTEIDQDPENGLLLYNAFRRLEKEPQEVFHKIFGLSKPSVLKKIIEKEPHFADAYYKLALCFKQNGKFRPIEMGNQDNPHPVLLLIKAIQLDPYHAKSYLTLSFEWSPLETIELEDSSVDMKDIIIRAIHFYPNNAELYIHLADAIGSFDQQVELVNGTKLGLKEILEICLGLDLTPSAAYNIRTNLTSVLFRLNQYKQDQETLNTHLKKLLLEAISIDPQQSTAYRLLGTLLKEKETITLLDQSQMSAKQLLVKSIDLEPHHHENYTFLSTLLHPKENILLLNGQFMTGKELTIKGITLNANDEIGYLTLALQTSPQEQTYLPDGRLMSRHQLWGLAFSKAVSSHISHLNFILEYFIQAFSEDHLILENGKILNQKQVYQTIIQKQNTCFLAYYKLGITLSKNEKIELFPKIFMDKKDLFLKTIELNPKYISAYQSLAHTLSKGETVCLFRGKKFDKIQLLIEAIHLHPENPALYSDLGSFLSSGKTILLRSKQKMQKNDLFFKAIHLDPNYANVYHHLAMNLSYGGCIEIEQGKKMNSLELYLKAVELDPYYEDLTIIIKAFMPFILKKVPLKLANGITLNFKEFIDKKLKNLINRFYNSPEIHQILENPFDVSLLQSTSEIMNFYQAISKV